MYGSVIIPFAVGDEVAAKEKSKAHAQLKAALDWIEIKSIKNVAQKQTFRIQLHDGEVEVIILGQELSADLLVIDDFNARECAKYLGFKVIGTVGILLLAKSKGFIPEVKPLLDELIANGIYISRRLYSEILKLPMSENCGLY